MRIKQINVTKLVITSQLSYFLHPCNTPHVSKAIIADVHITRVESAACIRNVRSCHRWHSAAAERTTTRRTIPVRRDIYWVTQLRGGSVGHGD